MCLRTKQKRLKLAKEDITVYKVIRIYPGCWDNNIKGLSPIQYLIEFFENYKYKSFYQLSEVPKDCVEKGTIYKAKGRTEKILSGKGKDYECYLYSGGLIHTFKYKLDALEIANLCPCECIIYKCIIPKWTRYIYGYDDSLCDTYASKRIVFCEPVYFSGKTKEWYDKLMNERCPKNT